MARVAHLARIISHETKIMLINRRIPAMSATWITGGGRTASGSADSVIRNPRGKNYSGWKDTGVGDPLAPIGISSIELWVQGHQKGNRLIGSIGSIV